jgi:hypothetical protein
MNKGLKWCLMSAIVFAAGCAYLTSGPSAPSRASSNSARPSVVTSGEMKSLNKAPTDDQLAGRTRRLYRRVYRRTA